MNAKLLWPTVSRPYVRRTALGIIAVFGVALLVIAALYLSGVLFLVFSKAHPRLATWNSIVDYWQIYADEPALRKRLLVSIATAHLVTLVLLPVALISASRPRRPSMVTPVSPPTLR